jgi:glycosyltransferase involved in cell wall biosynthesis
MRILVLTRYERLGSSSRVRFYQYYPYLEAHSVELVSAPFFSDRYVQNLYSGRSISAFKVIQAYVKRFFTLAGSGRFDLLWVEKELFPWLPAWFERLLHFLKIPYAVDYDDAVFHRYDMHRSPLVRALMGRKIDSVMRNAALVIVGNEYLAERAQKAGAQRIEVLPSVVDVSQYKLNGSTAIAPLRIGWVGSPVTAPYLDQVRNTLEILSRQGNFQLVLVGSGEIHPFGNIPTTLLPWDEKTETSIGEMFDVGIMPLIDGPFERGKCGYKLIQYMAGGLPVIASPVGVNTQIVSTGNNGYLANSEAEWLEAFQKLDQDFELRLKMGQSGRRKAEQMYNLQGTAPRLLDLLSSVRRT